MLDQLFDAVLTPINSAFLVIMVGVFAFGLRPGRKDTAARQLHIAAPALLTGLGILGTFVGILIGLLRFDVSAVQASIPLLLDGMKTAFLTSVVGLVLSLCHRAISLHRPGDPAQSGGVTLGDVVQELRDINAAARVGAQASQDQFTAIGQLASAIGGDADTSLLSQVKMLRQDNSDRLKELRTSFEEFAKQVSELGSKALIEALEHVIRDFNAKLTEQFGENFKQLNAAVAALVDWQDKYRLHVEGLEGQFERALAGIQSAERSLEEIAGAVERVPSPLDATRELLTTLVTEHKRLDEQLAAYAELRNQAISAFPVIEQNLNSLTTGMARMVEGTNEKALAIVQRQHATHEELTRGFERVRTGVEALTERQEAALATHLREAQERMASLARDYESTTAAALREMRGSFEESVKAHADVMQQQVSNLDSALEAELRKAIQQLGQHLAGLHEKIAADYEPLTANLHRMLQIGRAGN